MEAKDKAKQLVNKFKLKPIKPFCIMHTEHIKQCALIAVDEIQEYIIKYDNHVPDFKYWELVRKEIKNL